MEKIIIITIVFISILCLIYHIRKMFNTQNPCTGCGHSGECRNKNKFNKLNREEFVK